MRRFFEFIVIAPVLGILYICVGTFLLGYLYMLSLKIVIARGTGGLINTLELLSAKIKEVTDNVD